MADEYISKEAVLNSIHNGDIDMGMVTPHEYRLLLKLSRRIDRRIQRAPVSDVAPVRHGRWGKDNDCSECGCQPWFERDIHTLNYCPNCGAKMDGEVEE